MWTPKRVLLLSAGAAIFLAGYFVYAFFLGGIDGLTQLPEGFGNGEVKGLQFIPDSDIDKKLQTAFGMQCPQVKKRIKFEVRKKGLVIAAAEASFKEPDGRVKLTDCSVALFKDHGDGKFPEINTMRSDFAFLTFEEKIQSPMDMSKGKITDAELRGNILIINNHRTPEMFDDLEVQVFNEPLFYNEKAARIWSDGFVSLTDKQTQPHPTLISGRGMELHLTRDQPNDKKPAAEPRAKSELNGVDLIVLKSMVEMHLYTDATSGFMTGSNKPSPAAAKPKDPGDKILTVPMTDLLGNKKEANAPPAKKSHVTIKTNGTFSYDLPKDVARFDSPSNPERGFPDQVFLLRRPMADTDEEERRGPNDHLLCDHLTLKFRRKLETAGGARTDKKEKDNSTGPDREIESAHATARPGEEVVLSLDTESLACACQELIYQCPTAERGARTVLRGEPLEAVKDAHKIKAKELQLVSSNQKGAGQQIIAEGPGQVDLWDRNPGKGFTTHAIWKGLLTSTKYKEGDRESDLLTLTVDAAFIDDEHGQKLYGQRLQVWLESSDNPGNSTPVEQKADSANAGPRQLPRKVEAFEKVSADSAELRVRDCEHLTIRFTDIARSANTLPGPVPMQAPGGQGTTALQPPGARLDPPPLAGAVSQGRPQNQKEKEKDNNKDKGKPKQPVDLRARDVVADVLRGGDKNELQEVVAVGNVHVHQDPEKPGDKGVDIKGAMLNLVHFPEGDTLKVFGDSPKAELQLGELLLIGPKVTINQKENTAAVEGPGAMRMPSNATFDGAKPSKPGTLLVVHWTHDMLFTGRDADFNGGVVAYQDNSELQCQLLQVALDKTVSLKDGQKGDEPAKVEKVIAHNKVWVIDKEKDKSGIVVSQKALSSRTLVVNKQENQSIASGPGVVAILQPETGDEYGPTSSGPKQPKKDPAKPAVMTLTRVHFMDRMFTTELDKNTRKSTFNGNIQVIHVPAERMDLEVDVAKLPKGGLLLECDVLTVIESTLGGKKSQVMQAERRVRCWTDDMFAQAEVVIFDQTRDTVTFKGSPNNLAVVSQQPGGPGSPPKVTRAQTIQYNRKTGALQVDSASMMSGELPPEERLQPLSEFIIAKR